MSKTRNCRRTDEDRAIHDRACRLRKMTDAQLCDFIDTTYSQGVDQGTKLAERQKAGSPAEEGARRFVSYLEAHVGTGNKIGLGTVQSLYRELGRAAAEGIFAEASR